MRKTLLASLAVIIISALCFGCSGESQSTGTAETFRESGEADTFSTSAITPQGTPEIKAGETDAVSSEIAVAESEQAASAETTETVGEDAAGDSTYANFYDASWEELVSLGLVFTESGEDYIESTVPWDYVGEVTQEGLDTAAGETYTSAILNGDGSVTYKMTQTQREKTLLTLTERYEAILSQTVSSGMYTITSVTHNVNFSEFEVCLSTEEIGMEESFYALDLYAMGEEFSLYAGREGERYIVYFYNPGGGLIETYDSSMMV